MELVPLIIRADIAHLHVDILVYSTGCFLTPGYLTRALSQRYGNDLQQFLKNRFLEEKYSKEVPNNVIISERDSKLIEAGGLYQGFTAFVPAGELQRLASADPNAPPLVLAVAGGEYRGHITPNSVQNLIENIFETLNQEYPSDKDTQKIIAFPTIGLGTGGAGDDRIPMLTAQIQALKRGYSKHPHLVPVLITYSNTIHRLALAARKRVLDLNIERSNIIFANPPEQDIILKLQDELISNRLVLFVGAGASSTSGLPNWLSLIEKLAEKAGVKITGSESDSNQLLDVAETVRSILKDEFAKTLKEVLGFNTTFPPLPSLTHYLLASLSTRSIVTTNYDTLLEQALEHIKEVFFTINTPQNVARVPTSDEHTNVLKIHGDLTVPDEVIFTRRDYEEYFARRPAVSALLRGLLLNRTFIFIGYSLRDPNLHVILNEVGTLLKEARRPAYAIVFDANEEDVKNWQQKGVYFLRLKGANNQQKNFRLWQFLDLLQLKYFAPHRAWLAEDAHELVPEEGLEAQLDDLRKVLVNFSEELNKMSITQETADFLLPWLLLGAQHGLKLPSDTWRELTVHYLERKPNNEPNLLFALSSAISAFQASLGMMEDSYAALLRDVKKELFEE
ncbi:MAG: SIR2 family protein [Candidatus Hermodarchaeota archaeon]